MKMRLVRISAFWILPLPLFAQALAIIAMDQGPHHGPVRTLQNKSDKEVRVVTLAFKP